MCSLHHYILKHLITMSLPSNCAQNHTNLESRIDGILFRGKRIVIPTWMKDIVLEELHTTHAGATKMKKLARQYCYWIGIAMVKSCNDCATRQNSSPKAPLQRN